LTSSWDNGRVSVGHEWLTRQRSCSIISSEAEGWTRKLIPSREVQSLANQWGHSPARSGDGDARRADSVSAAGREEGREGRTSPGVRRAVVREASQMGIEEGGVVGSPGPILSRRRLAKTSPCATESEKSRGRHSGGGGERGVISSGGAAPQEIRNSGRGSEVGETDDTWGFKRVREDALGTCGGAILANVAMLIEGEGRSSDHRGNSVKKPLGGEIPIQPHR
jgi:hypothetical protein